MTNEETEWSEGQKVAVSDLGVTEIAEVGENGVLFIRDRGSTLECSAEEVIRRAPKNVTGTGPSPTCSPR